MYKCICGKEFDNPQKFNGHKQGCKTHIINKYGSWEKYLEIKTKGHSHIYEKIKAKSKKKKELELLTWISEKHICEKCGKVMTEKYGSGRFCSRTCANSRIRDERTKDKIRKSLIKNNKKDKIEKIKPKLILTCHVCGKEFISESNRKTCSKDCLKILFSKNAKEKNLGGPSTTSSYGKRGTYKGIHCDSSYELAFLIYCIDHNIKIKRNTDYFNYIYNFKYHKYYPDFYLEDYDTYIEIKGRDIGPVKEKLKGVADVGKKIKILHFEDLKECFEYVCETYNVHHSKYSSSINKLYD